MYICSIRGIVDFMTVKFNTFLRKNLKKKCVHPYFDNYFINISDIINLPILNVNLGIGL